MKVSEVFATRYLSAADLNGKEPTVTVESVELIEMDNNGKPEKKLVISFRGKEKTLVLNMTNSRSIADLYGDETDNWVGKAIKLVTTRVDFQGKRVLAIRIDPPDKQTNGAPPPKPAPVVDQFGDEIPF